MAGADLLLASGVGMQSPRRTVLAVVAWLCLDFPVAWQPCISVAAGSLCCLYPLPTSDGAGLSLKYAFTASHKYSNTDLP